MTFASSNRLQVAYKLEVTPNTTPGGNGTSLRVNGESLDFTVTTKTSDEIRSDRQKTNLLQVGAAGAGGFPFELSYKEYDPFIQGALQSAYGTFGTAGVSGTLTVTTTGTTINATAGATGNNVLTNIGAGRWIKCTVGGTSQYCLTATNADATNLTLNAATPLSGSLIGTGLSMVITCAPLANGTDLTNAYYTLEAAHADISPAVYRKYAGFCVNKMSLSLQSGNIVTGSFDFMGMSGSNSGTTSMGTPAASQVFDPMNAVSGLGALLEGGVALTGTSLKSLSLDIANNLRGQDAVGVLGYAGIGVGGLDVTGSVQAYFSNKDLLDKFVNNTATSLAFYIRDSAGNAYGFNMPKVKFSTGKTNASGSNQDMMVDLSFTAYMDPTLLKTLIISRM